VLAAVVSSREETTEESDTETPAAAIEDTSHKLIHTNVPPSEARIGTNNETDPRPFHEEVEELVQPTAVFVHNPAMCEMETEPEFEKENCPHFVHDEWLKGIPDNSVFLIPADSLLRFSIRQFVQKMFCSHLPHLGQQRSS